jgi:hypothetical protein
MCSMRESVHFSVYCIGLLGGGISGYIPKGMAVRANDDDIESVMGASRCSLGEDSDGGSDMTALRGIWSTCLMINT